MQPRSRLAALLLGVGGLLGSAVAPGRAADRLIETNVVYPAGALVQNGGRVINLRAPPRGITAATGDGATDDTAAFQDAYDYIKDAFVAASAAQREPLPSYIIYVPDGTYRLTSTIIYRGATDAKMNNIRFIGQSRRGTLLRLDDHLAAFQSALTPASVLAYQRPVALGASSMFKGGPSNNIATSNLCENLTINTGSGNPGAAGIYFQGANGALISNVTITAADQKGYCGVWLETGSVQAYLKDITIDGYDYGICSLAEGENDSAWEHISLNDPQVAAIQMRDGGVAMRDLDLTQALLHVPAVQFTGPGGASLVLFDSRLHGGSSSLAAVILTEAKQSLVLRNVVTSGDAVDVMNQGVNAVSGPFVSEYVSHPVTTLFDVPSNRSFAMSVEDTPSVAWETNLASWVSVNDYGAKGDGVTDDSAAIQAAFTAAASDHKTVVYFPGLSYKLTRSVSIPAQVQRVDFMFCQVSAGSFDVSTAASSPLVFFGKSGYTPINLAAARTVVAVLCSGNINNQQTAPVSTFLEACVNVGSGPRFCTAGQTVWARSPNDETVSESDLENTGGRLWIMGFKTENKTPLPIENVRGQTEILGGYINATDPVPNAFPPTLIANQGGDLCFTGFTNLNGRPKFPIAITETRNSLARTAAASMFPPRGGIYSGDLFIPLYLGGTRPRGPFGVFTAGQDVGSVACPGSSNHYEGQTYIIDGSGSDIGSAADSFQFLETDVEGNGSLSALVESVDGVDPEAKAALLFRSGLSPDDGNVAVTVSAAGGIVLQVRTVSGDATATCASQVAKLPYWVKLSRLTGTAFAACTSPDGEHWTALGSVVTANLPMLAKAGLGVTAHHHGGPVARAILTNVRCTTN